MKITLFQVGKQTVFLKFAKNLSDSFYITLASIIGMNQNIIEVHNDKNIKFFRQNFVNVVLKASGGIRKTKRHNLVLEIAILHSKSCFLLVILLNSYLIICICQFQLSRILGVTKVNEQSINQGKQVAILDCLVIELSIIYT